MSKLFLQKLLFLTCILCSQMILAQVTVSGAVYDSQGVPLPGANIIVKGTSVGTQTDFNGSYSIETEEEAVLIYSFIGFRQQEIVLKGRTKIDITLVEDATSLDEVIVTGYGSQSKREVTGAVTTIETKDLLAVPATTFAQQLQGRASGISIVNDATPGGEATVRIRGFGTIGNNDPLYIIDGVPSKSQSNLNPNDIETLQVLKDASAASIYGSRAANGVIIITTKKGKIGKPQISYSTFYGLQSVSEDVDALNAKELGKYLYLADLYAGKTPSHGQYKFGTNGEVTIPDYVFPSGTFEGTPGVNPNLYALEPGNIYPITRAADTYWWDEVTTRAAPTLSHQISASGATENSRYAMSLGYVSQEAAVKFVSYDRISLRANTEFRALDQKLKIGENFTVSFDNRKGGFGNNEEQNAVSSSYKQHPLLPVYDIMGNFAGSRGANLGNNFNPYAVLSRAQDNRRYRLRAFGNVFASYDILENLEFKTSLGVDFTNSRIKELGRPQPEYVEGNFINSSTARNSYEYQWIWNNILTYSATIKDKHKIDAYVGTEAIGAFGEEFGARRERFAFETTDVLSYLNLGDATTATNYGFVFNDYSLFSLFGKFNYAYDQKYLVQVILRNDSSSRFQSASRSAFFPAFSLGWRISDEKFFKNALPFIDDMKLRYGWGQTGNQEIGDYNAYTTYRSDILHAGYPIDGSTTSPTIGFDIQAFGNPNAKWETTTSNNYGVDVSMLNNRLTFNLDIWNRVTSDMLFQTPITYTAGDALAPYFNVGKMTNEGYDISLGYGDTKGDFGFNVTGNFSRYTNEVNQLDESEDTRFLGNTSRVAAVTLTQAGVPVSSFYGYQVLGIFQSQQEADAWAPYGSYNSVGKFKYADVNNDGIINDSDRTIIGSPHPEFTYGINIDLSYKNLTLNIFANGSQGNDIYNYIRYFADFNTFQGNRSSRALNDAWQPSNPSAPKSQWVAANPNATVPIMDANDQTSSQPSSYFIEDGSYFRLKSVQLSYNFPKSVLKSISGLQLYLQAQNIYTFTKYSGLNPEVQVGTEDDATLGFDGGYMPVSRTFILGLNVNL